MTTMATANFDYVEKFNYGMLSVNIGGFIIGGGDAFKKTYRDDYQLFGEKIGQTLGKQETAYCFKLIRGSHVIYITQTRGQTYSVTAKTLLDEIPISRLEFLKVHFAGYNPINAKDLP